MAFCINCGQELTEDAKFCANCGKAVNINSIIQRTTVYDGEIHKCPNCGEMLKSYVINCPSCGYEIRNLKTQSSVNKLAEKLEKATSVDEKIGLITNFYIPNTKEDICDFFILAVSNLEDTVYDTDDAWQAKLEQAYHKAKISFGNTHEFEYIEKLYNKTLEKVSKRGISNFIRKNKIACITALLIGIGIIMLVAGIVLNSLNLADEHLSGTMLLAIGINFIISPSWALEDMKKKEKIASKIKDAKEKNSIRIQSAGKEAEDFINEHYEDVVEQLKELGFKNIVVKAEKKGLLNVEGEVKGISIAGKSDFSDDDEFDVNSKIIIRYYSKNC